MRSPPLLFLAKVIWRMFFFIVSDLWYKTDAKVCIKSAKSFLELHFDSVCKKGACNLGMEMPFSSR